MNSGPCWAARNNHCVQWGYNYMSLTTQSCGNNISNTIYFNLTT